VKRKWLGIAVVLIVVAMLPIVVLGDEEPTYGGQISLSFGHHTPDIDKAFTPDFINNGGFPVMSTLIRWKWDSSAFVPDLAESWTISEDATTYTCKIRDNVKWHDGTVFTPDDVVWSWTIQLHPDVPTSMVNPGAIAKIVGLQDYKDGKVDYIAGITIKPENIVEFKLSEPDGTFLSSLAHLRIFPRHLLMNIEPRDLLLADFWQHPIGTGPFKFSQAVPGEYYECVRYDDYYGGRPYLDKIIVKSLVDSATRVLRFERGETDIIEIPPDQITYLQGLPNVEVRVIPTPKIRGLEWVFKKTDIDARVRTAIMKALDVPMLVNIIIGLGGTPLELVNSITAWALPEGQYEPWGYDPEGARALLEEARQDGVWTNRPIEIQTYYPDDVYRSLLEAMQSYLAAVGITMNPKVVDDATHMKEFYEEFTTDAALTATWCGPDPSLMADMISSANLYPAGWNGSYSNPEIDTLLDLAAGTADQEVRKGYYYQVQKIAHDDVAMGAMWAVSFAYGVNKRCHNVFIGDQVPNPQYWQVEKWWVDE